jgi:propionyl-CoA carboxylase alpha chain
VHVRAGQRVGEPAGGLLPGGGAGDHLRQQRVVVRRDLVAVPHARVQPHYDSLLAKVVVRAATREEAARRLADALARAHVHGVATNRDLLVRVLRSPAFAAGPDTGLLDRHPQLRAPLAGPDRVREAALAAALAAAARRRAAAPVLRTLPAGWRSNPSQPATAAYDGPDGTVEVAYRPAPCRVLSATRDEVVLERDGVRTAYAVHTVGEVSYVDGPGWAVTLSEVDPLPEPRPALPAGSLTAPMPGLVLEVRAAEGDRVGAGQPLLTLAAMKMEHPVLAPAAGTVTELRVAAGSQVDAGDLLVVVDPGEA